MDNEIGTLSRRSRGWMCLRGTRSSVAALVIVACAIFCGGPEVYAVGNAPVLLLAQADVLSQDAAAAKVRKETGGRVLDIQTEDRDGTTVYLVKVLLPDGLVRVVPVSSK